jgi:cyclic pyranopterin phosphate synthase
MPADGIQKLAHSDILSFEEIAFIAGICAAKGIESIRLTGGDPLVRRNIAYLVALLKKIPGIRKVVLTTNGLELGQQLHELAAAGLDGVNVSLDALDETVFSQITRRTLSEHGVRTVLSAVDEALKLPGFTVKLNCVPSGFNDKELLPLALLAKDRNLAVRFIELMPIGCAVTSGAQFRSSKTVFDLLEKELGPLEKTTGDRYQYFTAPGFKGTIGFISPVTQPFCASCNRLRLTADGYIKSCLQYRSTRCLKPLLTEGLNEKTAEKISAAIDAEVRSKRLQNCFPEQNSEWWTCADSRNMNQIGG